MMEVKCQNMGAYAPMKKRRISRSSMTRKNLAFAISVLLLFSLLSGVAGAEEPSVATPTDLACAHEHTKTTIYFFDGPAYTSNGADSHTVSGPATVVTVCLDCGETLSSETVDNAEEVRPHSMKKGACALCGYRPKTKAAAPRPTDAPGERTIIAQEDGTTDGLLILTLTDEDLYRLENENVTTIIVRGREGDVAVALDVPDLLGRIGQYDMDLLLQLAERPDGSLFANLNLVGPGKWTVPADTGVTLRFYRSDRTEVRPSVTPTDGESMIGVLGVWNDGGYWTIPYTEEGTYFLLQ